MAFIPIIGALSGLGEAGAIAAAAAVAAAGAIIGIAGGVAAGHPHHTDPDSGIAPDDEDHDGDYPDPPGKNFPSGSRDPGQSHMSQQEAYVNSSNEVSHDYWHKFNLICRKFYTRHRRMAVNHPERYVLALLYFLRRNRRVPRRVITRSGLLQHDRFVEMSNSPVARRARGRAFLAS